MVHISFLESVGVVHFHLAPILFLDTALLDRRENMQCPDDMEAGDNPVQETGLPQLFDSRRGTVIQHSSKMSFFMR